MTEPVPPVNEAAEREHQLTSNHSRMACICGRWESGSFAEHIRSEGGIAWAVPQTQAGRDLQLAAAGEYASPAGLDWWGQRIVAIEREATGDSR